MLYLLHGPDEYSIQQTIAGLKVQLGDPELAALNTTVLDGRRASVAEVITAADALPFLAARRLVIVEGLLAQWSHGRRQPDEDPEADLSPVESGASAQLCAYLEHMPDTTWLVLVESDIDRRTAVFKLAQKLQAQERAVVREYQALDKDGLVRWVRQRIQAAGGRIEDRAAALLAELVGNDLRLLGQETDKLLAYAGGERAITVADVEALCSYVPEANIFHLVDALGRRDRRAALRLLHRLLDEGQAALYLLTMITRQFRILLSIKDLEQRRTPANVMPSELKLHPFVVDKGRAQARNFSLAQLGRIYRRLVEIDVASKTGQMDPDLALDLFVVETCRG